VHSQTAAATADDISVQAVRITHVVLAFVASQLSPVVVGLRRITAPVFAYSGRLSAA